MKLIAVGFFAVAVLFLWGLSSGTREFGLIFVLPGLVLFLGFLLALESWTFRYINKNGSFALIESDIDEHKTRSRSRLGIASLVISVVAGMLALTTFMMIAGVMLVSGPDSLDEQDVTGYTFFLGLMLFGSVGLAIVAFGLGISSLIIREKKKLFAILGIVFSSTLALLLLLMMYGGPA